MTAALRFRIVNGDLASLTGRFEIEVESMKSDYGLETITAIAAV